MDAMEEQLCSASPVRLSERRGKPELQPLDPSHMGLGLPADVDTHSSDSSIPSGIFSPESYATPVMSAPTTPTDISPLRMLASPFGTRSSSIVGTSIKEEDEVSDCGCRDYDEDYGLGLAVGNMGTKDVAFPRLDSIRTVREAFGPPCYDTHYHFNEKLAPVTLPPTPPANSCEQSFLFSPQTSPTSPSIDAEVFCSGPPSLPQSPKSESASRSRAATILNKVVPQKLRASLKRRMSGVNDNANQPPPHPPLNTMPTSSDYRTPSVDACGDLTAPRVMALEQDQNSWTDPTIEAILPPMLSPRLNSIEGDQCMSLPHSPMLACASAFLRIDGFPTISCPASPNGIELVNSPLHPPTISPLMSPSLASASQTSLGITSQHSLKKAPSIDPATPSASKKPSAPLSMVTANTLADMIEEMQSDLAAYDAARTRMVESGWSSPQEIRNVELQREEYERSWQASIAESKKILEGKRRTEAKDSATSSVASLECFGSVSAMSSSTSSNAASVYSFAGSERQLPG